MTGQTVIVDMEIVCQEWPGKRLPLHAISSSSTEAAWAAIRKKSRAVPIVSIRFTNDAEIKKLNRKFRGKNKPTNVLSFQSWPGVSALPSGPVAVGDIVVAFETVKREAAEKRIAFRAHLNHLLVHGFLHLFGFDHLDDDEAHAMETLEIRILERLGIKNPYAEN